MLPGKIQVGPAISLYEIPGVKLIVNVTSPPLYLH